MPATRSLFYWIPNTGMTKAISYALALFIIALPAAAQTVTISASGNCAGTPANCGTGGDRDTDWDGLQVDEGDEITFVMNITNTGSLVGYTINFSLIGSGATADDVGTIRLSGADSGTIAGIPSGRAQSLFVSGGAQNYHVPVTSDGVLEADEVLTFRIDNLIDGIGSIDLSGVVLPSVTVTIRGTNTAPAFRDSVTAKVFPNNTPINLTIPAATGGNGPVSYTTTNLPAGLSFQGACGNRILCGTPTTLGTTTIEITATDADCNPGPGLDCSMATTTTAMTDADTLTFDLRIADAYRLTDLNQDGSLDDTDAFNLFRAYLRIPNVDATISQRATDWKDNGSAQGGDLNSDRSINQNDALIMYYAYRFGALLDNHSTLRQLLLNGVRGQMPPTDATYQELLRRARGLR